jgi:hypothetical protein
MSIVHVLLVFGVEMYTKEEDGEQTQSVDEEDDVLESTIDHITQSRVRLSGKYC